jgi:hypothetical protein
MGRLEGPRHELQRVRLADDVTRQGGEGGLWAGHCPQDSRRQRIVYGAWARGAPLCQLPPTPDVPLRLASPAMCQKPP